MRCSPPRGSGSPPLVLVLGPRGSAKTTSVVRSGLEPELLAGEVERGETVIPTDGLNVWFSQGTIFVEAAGNVVEDERRWARLIKHLRPARLGAALAQGAQAPRTVVVCMSCEEFLVQGSSQAVAERAKLFRNRLVELSGQLGVRLPVYTLFTKADRLPYFGDFVRSFTRAESQQLFGAVLNVEEGASSVGAYAEHQSRRLNASLRELFHGLARHRLEMLPREAREEVRGGVYEFPREFRKISELSVQFLLDLCRPSQLSVSPFLRGFHFTGVRPVFVADSAGAEAPAISPGPSQISLGATSVFNPQMLQDAQPASSPAAAGTRKVPEWVFLPRFFGDVVLGDRVAMAITGGGKRVNGLRRVLLGAAAAACWVLFIGFTVSYFGNRGLARNALAAVESVQPFRSTESGPPSEDALVRLDSLRVEVAQLRAWERSRPPLRLRWGLYTGERFRPDLRRLYFDRFERLVWDDARGGLLASLAALPETPNETSEYGIVYDALKSHLITTSHPQESTPEFLTPVLERNWSAARELDAERLELARRNFDFYAAELPLGNPYTDGPRDATVARTRVFLQNFADTDRLYQALVTEASQRAAPVQFHRAYPGAEPVVQNTFLVPGAFTTDGWNTVQASLADVDQLFNREAWVIGEQTISAEDRARLAQSLRERYVREYIQTWREYLSAGTVVAISGPADAAAKLQRLAGNESPILQMLALASQHTAVDSITVGRAFQPVHVVLPPGHTDRFVVDENAGYIRALSELQSAFAQAAIAQGPARSQALMQASTSAEQVRGEVRQFAQSFSLDGEARMIGTTVQRLLQSPLGSAETVISGAPAAEINAKGAAFCRAFRPIAGRYPFSPGAAEETTVDQFSEVFQRGSSLVWAFYEEALQELLQRQGPRYGPRVGATPAPNRQFIDFFNRAVELSEAFYDERGNGPEVSFLLRPQTSAEVPEISVSMDGRTQTFTRTFANAQSFTWQGSRASSLRISATIDGAEVPVVDERGTWAVFRAFQRAEWQNLGGNRYSLVWRIPDRSQTVSAELTLAGSTPPIFQREYLSRLSGCVSAVVR
jgi:type VI secretion system protein ImpL